MQKFIELTKVDKTNWPWKNLSFKTLKLPISLLSVLHNSIFYFFFTIVILRRENFPLIARVSSTFTCHLQDFAIMHEPDFFVLLKSWKFAVSCDWNSGIS